MSDDRKRRVAVITISDGVVAGTRQDISGETAATMLRQALEGIEIESAVISDDRDGIEGVLRDCASRGFSLVVTSGGTGISPRDNTPQATLTVLDYVVPGLAELMRLESYKQTPMAALSRAVAGVCGRTLIVNLPGSPRGVRECLSAILPVLPHALEQIESGAGHPR